MYWVLGVVVYEPGDPQPSHSRLQYKVVYWVLGVVVCEPGDPQPWTTIQGSVLGTRGGGV